MPRPQWTDLLGAVLVCAPPAALALWTRALTPGGALAGFACAVAIYLGTFLAGISVLGMALLVTTLSTRAGRARQQLLGATDDRDARRGARNVLANCLVGAVGGLVAAFSDAWHDAGTVLVVSGLAAGASDTAASEIGKAYGGQPRAFPTFRAVPPGTPGAVSIVGALTGIAAAALIALPGIALWLLRPDQLPVIVAACVAGAFVESALSTRFEAVGVVDNDTLNLLNTMTAAAVALWWT